MHAFCHTCVENLLKGSISRINIGDLPIQLKVPFEIRTHKKSNFHDSFKKKKSHFNEVLKFEHPCIENDIVDIFDIIFDINGCNDTFKKFKDQLFLK